MWSASAATMNAAASKPFLQIMTSDIYGNGVRTLVRQEDNIAKPRALAVYESRELAPPRPEAGLHTHTKSS